MKCFVRKGDLVRVIAGDAKDQEGIIIKVYAGERVVISGIFHGRKYINGKSVDRPMPIHVSNVKLLKKKEQIEQIEKKPEETTEEK